MSKQAEIEGKNLLYEEWRFGASLSYAAFFSQGSGQPGWVKIKAIITVRWANQRISFTSVAFETVPRAAARTGCAPPKARRLRLARIYFIIISSGFYQCRP